jgi:hypothetical protein
LAVAIVREKFGADMGGTFGWAKAVIQTIETTINIMIIMIIIVVMYLNNDDYSTEEA